jgi:SAM-dependent methyltransferase
MNSTKTHNALKLHLRCGTNVVEGWINIDYSLGAHLAKIPLSKFFLRKTGLLRNEWDSRIMLHDLRKKLPFGDNTVDCIYTSHTLEHLNKADGYQMLSESYRVLKPNGILRVVVPDLKAIVADYVENKIKSDDFLLALHVGYEEESDSGFKKVLAPFVRFPHKCMYDETRLVEIMTEIGFKAKAMKPFDSDISGIHDIEIESRTIDAVIVEGKK